MVIIDLLLAIVGGFVGTLLRYGVSYPFHRDSPSEYIYGTMIANYLGCFFAGLLYPLASGSKWMKDYLLPLLSVGFCGALTTFGGYAYDVVVQFQNNDYTWLGVVEVFAINIGCFLFVYIGYIISSQIMKLTSTSPAEATQEENEQPEAPNSGEEETEGENLGNHQETEL